MRIPKFLKGARCASARLRPPKREGGPRPDPEEVQRFGFQYLRISSAGVELKIVVGAVRHNFIAKYADLSPSPRAEWVSAMRVCSVS